MRQLAHITRTLFPRSNMRVSAVRRARTTSGLSQVVAIGCALMPLGVMVQAYSMTV